MAILMQAAPLLTSPNSAIAPNFGRSSNFLWFATQVLQPPGQGVQVRRRGGQVLEVDPLRRDLPHLHRHQVGIADLRWKQNIQPQNSKILLQTFPRRLEVDLQGKQLHQGQIRRAPSPQEHPVLLRERATDCAADLRGHRHLEGIW